MGGIGGSWRWRHWGGLAGRGDCDGLEESAALQPSLYCQAERLAGLPVVSTSLSPAADAIRARDERKNHSGGRSFPAYVAASVDAAIGGVGCWAPGRTALSAPQPPARSPALDFPS